MLIENSVFLIKISSIVHFKSHTRDNHILRCAYLPYRNLSLLLQKYFSYLKSINLYNHFICAQYNYFLKLFYYFGHCYNLYFFLYVAVQCNVRDSTIPPLRIGELLEL